MTSEGQQQIRKLSVGEKRVLFESKRMPNYKAPIALVPDPQMLLFVCTLPEDLKTKCVGHKSISDFIAVYI